MKRMGTTPRAVFPEFQPLRVVLLVLGRSIRPLFALRAFEMDDYARFTLFGH